MVPIAITIPDPAAIQKATQEFKVGIDCKSRNPSDLLSSTDDSRFVHLVVVETVDRKIVMELTKYVDVKVAHVDEFGYYSFIGGTVDNWELLIKEWCTDEFDTDAERRFGTDVYRILKSLSLTTINVSTHADGSFICK